MLAPLEDLDEGKIHKGGRVGAIASAAIDQRLRDRPEIGAAKRHFGERGEPDKRRRLIFSRCNIPDNAIVHKKLFLLGGSRRSGRG